MCPSQQSVQVVAGCAVPHFFVLSCMYPKSFQAAERSDVLFAASTRKDLSPDSAINSKTSAGRSPWSRSVWECAFLWVQGVYLQKLFLPSLLGLRTHLSTLWDIELLNVPSSWAPSTLHLRPTGLALWTSWCQRRS